MARRSLQGSSPGAVEPLDPAAFRKALGGWYRRHARVLPWRGVQDPYATWLSEIMLQQTRVATVIERYGEFLRQFPTISALAAAHEDDVLALWSGLGYYRRARMLHRGAQFLERELGGTLPRTSVELRTLPGVGDYTAAAIASIAFGESIAVLDGNVERVLLRLLGRPEEKNAAARTLLVRQANELVPPAASPRKSNQTPGDHNQAMMELGATICLPRNPLCLHCPVFAFCQTRGEHRTAARTPLRSRHVACLLATRKRGTVTEVLLERRSSEATLMPGMLELPPLPLDAVAHREPVLRLRHSITNTNYYVEIFAEGASGTEVLDLPEAEFDHDPAPLAGEASQMKARLDTPLETQLNAQLPLVAPDALVPEHISLRPEAWLSLPQLTGSGGLTGSAEGIDPAEMPEEPFRGAAGERASTGRSLLGDIPAAETSLEWLATQRLHAQPLTGLARKALQRLGLMPMMQVRVGAGKGAV